MLPTKSRYGMIYFEILCTFPIQDDLIYSSVMLIPRSSIDVWFAQHEKNKNDMNLLFQKQKLAQGGFA
jgi:hypothetical protein